MDMAWFPRQTSGSTSISKHCHPSITRIYFLRGEIQLRNCRYYSRQQSARGNRRRPDRHNKRNQKAGRSTTHPRTTPYGMHQQQLHSHPWGAYYLRDCLRQSCHTAHQRFWNCVGERPVRCLKYFPNDDWLVKFNS